MSRVCALVGAPVVLCSLSGTAAQAGDPLPEPRPIRAGRLYRPAPTSHAVRVAAPVGLLRCSRAQRRRFGAHVELFANRYSLVVPAGIGVAPPFRREGAFVRGGRCSYPLRTLEPTGVIEVERGTSLTLADFFAVWGQPLSRRRLAGFRAKRGDRVRAFVAGREWTADVRAIPLRDHAQVVLEIGGHVPPH